MSRIRSAAWPRALTGHAVTAPPRNDINSRRLIGPPRLRTSHRTDLNQHTGRGSMSALCQKRTFRHLFDHLAGGREHASGTGEAERLGSRTFRLLTATTKLFLCTM